MVFSLDELACLADYSKSCWQIRREIVLKYCLGIKGRSNHRTFSHKTICCNLLYCICIPFKEKYNKYKIPYIMIVLCPLLCSHNVLLKFWCVELLPIGGLLYLARSPWRHPLFRGRMRSAAVLEECKHIRGSKLAQGCSLALCQAYAQNGQHLVLCMDICAVQAAQRNHGTCSPENLWHAQGALYLAGSAGKGRREGCRTLNS